VAIVVLTACFPQNRVLFLVSLALWGGACAFVSTVVRNFAAYAAALAGYTAVIIASDQLGSVGGLNGDAFMLAITRVTEIGIGIVSAGIVLAGTDMGGARRRLATLIAGLAAGIMTKFTATLQAAGPNLPDMQPIRRDFIRRVIALDPIIDQAVGESSEIRYHSPVLQQAVAGLFSALSGWRTIANHLVSLPDDQARVEAAIVLQSVSSELMSLLDQSEPACWAADPLGLHRICEAGIHKLNALHVETPSLRLIADQTAEALGGVADALNGLTLLNADPAIPAPASHDVFHLYVPDWVPALVNAVRSFTTILAVSAFWMVTGWPGGAGAITWAAISSLLFAARADAAYVSAKGFATGTCIAAVAAAVTNFAVLPNLETFIAFSLAIGLWLVPSGSVAKRWSSLAFTCMTLNFVPLLAPANRMSYDTVQFYNAALAVVSGAGMAALFFCLIPPLTPALRTRRLLALTLRDLRHLASERTFNDWVGHIHSRLSAMPAAATPLQRAQVLAALSLGTEILRLSSIGPRLGIGADLSRALTAIAQGRSAIAIAELQHLDEGVAGFVVAPAALQARGSIIVISGVLNQHAAYFDGEDQT
jgi:uncharacterized membrane protein YccC